MTCTGPGASDSLHRSDAPICPDCGYCESEGEYVGCCRCRDELLADLHRMHAEMAEGTK